MAGVRNSGHSPGLCETNQTDHERTFDVDPLKGAIGHEATVDETSFERVSSDINSIVESRLGRADVPEIPSQLPEISWRGKLGPSYLDLAGAGRGVLCSSFVLLQKT